MTEGLLKEIEVLGEEVAAFIEQVPPDRFTKRPEGEEWSVAHIAGHLSEAPMTMSSHALRLSRNPGASVGRELDDADRMTAVGSLAGARPAESAAAVRKALQQAVQTLGEISPDGWNVTGVHNRMGEVTVRQLVEAVVLGHVRGHLDQARQILAAVS